MSVMLCAHRNAHSSVVGVVNEIIIIVIIIIRYASILDLRIASTRPQRLERL